jgi:hypothetical protein
VEPQSVLSCSREHHPEPHAFGTSTIINKFWEELIAYFPFTSNRLCDTGRTKFYYVYTNKSIKRRWDAYPSFDNWLRHSNNIKVITLTILDASVLVLLIGGIYEELLHWHGLRWHETHTKLHQERFGSSAVVRVNAQNWSQKPTFIFIFILFLNKENRLKLAKHSLRSAGSFIIRYINFRTNNLSCFLPYYFPVLHVSEWYVEADL